MKRYNITVNGVTYDVAVEPASANAPAAAPATGGTAGSVKINAPMPGNIIDIKVAIGQQVKSGQVLLILEAMKMENEIVAPSDGVVASIDVKKGDTIESNVLMLSLN